MGRRYMTPPFRYLRAASAYSTTVQLYAARVPARHDVAVYKYGVTGAHAAGSGSNHIFVHCRHLA